MSPPKAVVGNPATVHSKNIKSEEHDHVRSAGNPKQCSAPPTSREPRHPGLIPKPSLAQPQNSVPGKDGRVKTQLEHLLKQLSQRKTKLLIAVERIEATPSRTQSPAVDATAPADRFGAAADACRDYWTLLRDIIVLRRSLPPSSLKQKLIDAEQSTQVFKHQPSGHTGKKKKKKRKREKRDALWRAQGQTRKTGSHRSSS
jgi:hypothetical protein